MAWVTPTNVATGDVLTASKWNQDVVENTNVLYKPPAAYVYRTSTDTASNGTWLRPSWSAELYDTDTMVDIATSPTRITIKTAGLYIVEGATFFDNASTSGSRFLAISKNSANADPSGGVIAALYHVESGQAYLRAHATAVHRFAANDYISMHIYQNHGSSMVVGTATTASGGFVTGPTSGGITAFFMSATWIGNPA